MADRHVLIARIENYNKWALLFSSFILVELCSYMYSYPLQNVVLGGYTVFSMSMIPSFCHSVILSTFKIFIL